MLSIPRIATSDEEKHSNFDVQVGKEKKKKVGVIDISMVQAISNQHVGRLRLVETTTNAY
jgi:hypothetical protein